MENTSQAKGVKSFPSLNLQAASVGQLAKQFLRSQLMLMNLIFTVTARAGGFILRTWENPSPMTAGLLLAFWA